MTRTREGEVCATWHGIGQAATPGMEESFTSRTLVLDVQVQREVGAGIWLGLRTQLQSEGVLESTRTDRSRVTT